MLIELDNYPIFMIAKELSSSLKIDHDCILYLLREGKLQAHCYYNSLTINIPRTYWHGIPLEKFSLFDNDFDCGREVYVRRTPEIISCYRDAIECLDIAFKERCWNYINEDILKSIMSIDVDNPPLIMEDGPSINIKKLKEDFDILSCTLEELTSIKMALVSAFSSKKSRMPAYISNKSWSKYNENIKGEKNKKGAGRNEKTHWRDSLGFLISCIILKQKQDIFQLLKIERNNRSVIYRAMRNFISQRNFGGSDPGFEARTYEGLFGEIDDWVREGRDLSFYLKYDQTEKNAVPESKN